MASYDSDSSLEDEEDYAQTKVLLGYATKKPTDDPINQLGGHPSWLDHSNPPSAALVKCKVCDSLMSLLLQLNGDLPEVFADHERRLYVWSCRKKVCRKKEGSVRGFRATRITASRNAQENGLSKVENVASARDSKGPARSLGESLMGAKSSTSSGADAASAFSTNANPFSTSSTGSSANPFSQHATLAAKSPQTPSKPSDADALSETFASKARITSPPPWSLSQITSPLPWPDRSSFSPAYPAYFLDAAYESLDTPLTENLEIQSTTTMQYEGEDSASGVNAENAAFESSLDRTFQRFADRLAQNPEQVIRYEFDGQPLLYRKDDMVGKIFDSQYRSSGKVQTIPARGVPNRIPRCQNCGSHRVFELQLTPHAITELEAEEPGIEGMEWGSIVLAVCAQDCLEKGRNAGEVGYVEEWVGAQWEEKVERR